MSKYLYTTQKEVRRAFWENHPEADRRKITDYSGRGKMYKTDTRVAFCNFIESLSRDGSISLEMAQNITLLESHAPSGLKRVYTFPNGFQRESEQIFKALQFERLSPSWKFDGGDSLIYLPANEYPVLLKLAECRPSRWGNASEIKKNARKG